MAITETFHARKHNQPAAGVRAIGAIPAATTQEYDIGSQVVVGLIVSGAPDCASINFGVRTQSGQDILQAYELDGATELARDVSADIYIPIDPALLVGAPYVVLSFLDGASAPIVEGTAYIALVLRAA